MSDQPNFNDFLATADLADLGPGPRPGVQTPSALRQQLQPLLKAAGLSLESEELLHALVLLWHDHLDEAHTIAQSIDNTDGAFVDGIMHRREPDYGNAAYWFRRVGQHPAFASIARQSGPLLNAASNSELGEKIVRDGNWDPFAFINACAGASELTRGLLQQLQKAEFSALLNHLHSGNTAR